MFKIIRIFFRKSLEEDGSLLIRRIQKRDRGNYTCVLKDTSRAMPFNNNNMLGSITYNLYVQGIYKSYKVIFNKVC